MNIAAIRDTLSSVALKLCKDRGMYLTFYNGTATSGIGVYANIDNAGQSLGQEDVAFRVPRQTGFPPNEFAPPMKLTISGVETFHVNSIEPDNERPDMSITCVLNCTKFLDQNGPQ